MSRLSLQFSTLFSLCGHSQRWRQRRWTDFKRDKETEAASSAPPVSSSVRRLLGTQTLGPWEVRLLSLRSRLRPMVPGPSEEPAVCSLFLHTVLGLLGSPPLSHNQTLLPSPSTPPGSDLDNPFQAPPHLAHVTTLLPQIRLCSSPAQAPQYVPFRLNEGQIPTFTTVTFCFTSPRTYRVDHWQFPRSCVFFISFSSDQKLLLHALSCSNAPPPGPAPRPPCQSF